MITVIGTNGCTHCMIAKNKLNQKGITFEYKLITDFTGDEQDKLLSEADKCGITKFPLIVENNQLKNLEEILNG